MLEDYFKRVLNPAIKRPVQSSCAISLTPIPAANISRVHEFTEGKRTFRHRDYESGKWNKSEEPTLLPSKIWLGQFP
jgi:hypothetical protein